jgi:hypothetical protein
MGLFSSIARLFSRVGTALGLWIDKSTETAEFDEAIIESEIRNQKVKADKAHYANGQLQSQIMLLKDQVKRQEQKLEQNKFLLDGAIKANDEANGAVYAEELANLEADLTENKQQLTSLQQAYEQNTQIIAESIRQIQKFQRDFEALKVKRRISDNMKNLAQLMKASVTELNGMVGGEASSAMERMRTASVQGQGQITATLDLAKEMGSNIRMQQDARKARGKALFEQYKSKANQSVQAPIKETEAQPEKQKIAVPA